MSTYLIYVRQSYHRAADADVSPEQQEAAAVARLPRPERRRVLAWAVFHGRRYRIDR